MTEQTMTDSESEDHTYDISTVTQMTGLTAANLRVWEKRYQAVKPVRSSGGRRQYSRSDLQRLTLLKTLVDLGHGIKASAKLPNEEIERRIEESSLLEVPGKVPKDDSCRICVVGSYIGTMFDGNDFMPERAVKVADFSDIASASQATLPEAVDLLFIECPALLSHEIAGIESLISRTNCSRTIVIYTYTSRGVLEALESAASRITAVRAPVSKHQLKELCETNVALANRSLDAVIEKLPEVDSDKNNIPARQFSERQLALISEISTGVKCECPHHLVTLLKSLKGFEGYSAECENANAADAEIHAYLHKSTAHARSIVEDALKALIDFEGFTLEEE